MRLTQQELGRRIKAVLPSRWFGENTPVLDAVLAGLSVGWLSLFNLLDYVASQARVTTASGIWLDAIASDFFKALVRRRPRETDDNFRQRIVYGLNADRCTRRAIYQGLLDLTAKPPTIFEPLCPQDTGCYGQSGPNCLSTAGFGVAGRWGSRLLPFQAFVTVRRPDSPRVFYVNGWGGSIGGYGAGSSAYVAAMALSTPLSDAELYGWVAWLAPAGSKIWVQIEP